ncbi:unnamed protein product [Ascophyllum nodosum]
MEARLANTARACKLVAPTAWKANQNACAEFLGKLYCNSMTIGKIGISAPLARRGYWSRIRGCLYSDFGVGLFPGGAMFNHSCAPNCAWLTDLPSGKLRVIAVQDVAPGSQLCISYVDILQPGPTRRGLLREHFFFDCACQRCLGPRSLRRSARRRLNSPPPPLPPSYQPGSPFSSSPYSSYFSPEDLVSGGWICHERSCCGKGIVLPTGGDRGRVEWGAGSGSGGEGAKCTSCGWMTGEAYFDRWTELLGARLTSADLDLERGRVAEGRVKLEALKILCEKRLSSTNSFAFGVISRLMLAAAVDEDWKQTAAFAERSLQCLRALRLKNNTRSSEADPTGAASGDPLPSTAIWEAVVIEVLDRSLPLAGRKADSEADSHAVGVEMAERAAALWGLRRASLVEL